MSEVISGLEPTHVSVIPTREDVSKLVVALQQSKDINTDQRAAQGYKNLFTAIFTSSPNPEDSSVKAIHVLTPEEFTNVKKTVSALFLQCTLTEPTSFYRSKKTGKAHEHWGFEYSGTTLNPTQVYILVNKFGLLDGVKKTHIQIGKSLDVSPTRSRQLTFRALRKIRNSDMFKKLASDIFKFEQKPG